MAALLPSILPARMGGARHALSQRGSDHRYAIETTYRGWSGEAGFAAMFAVPTGPIVPPIIPGVAVPVRGRTAQANPKDPPCSVPAGAPPGMTSADTQIIWDAGNLGAYGTDIESAYVAALAAVTWYGENGFSMSPKNNLRTGDYGRMQINYEMWSRAPADVFGALGVPRFNGSTSANIAYAEARLENYYLPRYGPMAAGAYVSPDGISSLGALANASALEREGFWSEHSGALTSDFANQAWFTHQ
ncbi:MAG: hypothetical protein ACRD1M_16880 [Terriglobales bacterium]